MRYSVKFVIEVDSKVLEFVLPSSYNANRQHLRLMALIMTSVTSRDDVTWRQHISSIPSEAAPLLVETDGSYDAVCHYVRVCIAAWTTVLKGQIVRGVWPLSVTLHLSSTWVKTNFTWAGKYVSPHIGRGGGFRLVNDNVIYLEVAIAVLRYLSRNSDARSTVRHAEAEFVDTETQGKFLMGGSWTCHYWKVFNHVDHATCGSISWD